MNMNARALPVGVVLAVCLMWLGGCSAYVEGYRYVPRPAVALVPGTQPSQPPPVATIVSIVGVHREDKSAGVPESVEVRMRIENNSPETVVFDPKSIELLDGGLMEFPPPIVRPPQPETLAPQQSVVVGAFFPFPPGHSYKNTDLESLELRWRIQIGGSEITQSADFRRMIRPYYYYPYPDYSPYPFYGGVGLDFVFVGRGGHRR
jgi:hypothetical protein